MAKFIQIIMVGVVTSMFYYPFSFTFLPTSVNTKLILAVLGLSIFIAKGSLRHALSLSKEVIYSALIAALFSLACLVSTDINHTSDYSYVDYIFTFFVWIFSAYFVGYSIYKVHRSFNLTNATFYLAGVSVFQCIIAVVIDNNSAVKNAVDSIVYQGVSYLEEVNRMYGIGASLDPAGVRFAIVLILIMFTLLKNKSVRTHTYSLVFLITSFLIISTLGNMISRTTTTGIVFALVSLFFVSGFNLFYIKASDFKLISIFIILLVLAVAVFVILYRTNPYYEKQLRFAFEGFFNWVETGKFTTGSTEKLQNVMWIWPQDPKTWIIGSGIFGIYSYSTDIGYCRFVLYCGLVGFSTFVFFFLFNAIIFMNKYKKYMLLFLVLFLLALTIWVKVSTDIFQIFALFYWLTDIDSESIEDEESEEDNNELTISQAHSI